MPAVVLGMTPAIAGYVSLAVKHTMSVAGNATGTNLYNPAFIDSFVTIRGFYAEGMFALGQGFIYTCMILAGITYFVIDRRFFVAANWCLVGALLSVIGFTHSYELTPGDVIGQLAIPTPIWTKWTSGYVAMAIVFCLAPYFTKLEQSTD
jgi:AGZA family xanthine/uracil permease-like MFS transporter